MEIILNKEAPPEIVRLIQAEYEEIPTIKKVIIDTDIDLHGNTGVFNPNTGAVIIDMGTCVTNMGWMEKGMLYMANVWSNLLYVVFHEGAHAKQFDQSPESFELGREHKDAILEHAADIEALEKMVNWYDENKMPVINEWGWPGEYIRTMFNSIYTEKSDMVHTEVDAFRADAAGKASLLAAHNPYFEDEKAVLSMYAAIDNGDVGLIIKEDRYLRANEALEVIINTNRS